MHLTTDKTAKELAEEWGCTPRSINLYRAQAESIAARKFGYKQGKAVYFSPEEQELIKRAKVSGPSTNAARSQQRSADFQGVNFDAEDGILGGMGQIVQAGDQNALAIGQALGNRWNNLMWTAALQTMQTGMMQMQGQFEELHASVSITVDELPQLTGTALNSLPPADETDE